MNTGVWGARQMSQPPQSYVLNRPAPRGRAASASFGYDDSSVSGGAAAIATASTASAPPARPTNAGRGNARDERPRAAAASEPQQHEERRERREAEELRTIDPHEAREEDGGEPRDDGEERPLRSREERVRDHEPDENGDREGAHDDDPAPIARQIRGVDDELAEPLVDRRQRSGRAPREHVDAHESFRERPLRCGEMPEEIRIVDPLLRRERPERGGARERYDTARSRHGRSRRIQRPGSSPRTRQPSSLSAPASGRSGRRSATRISHRARTSR